ncbi:MAG: adenylyltransferase/cytidyltransferase family protein [Candidatus Magasanikbacteria bacterium]|nr:adenylyltransferase/cytidyltransferase family protein [Candidatus Magasanikbacteria bacterium]
MTKRTKTVMVFGTFDILHLGHIHMFEKARQYGDKLVAVVARDINVEKVKGVGPFNSERERLKFVKHIDLVDGAVLGDKTDVYKVIKKIKPEVIALGYDQKNYVDKLGHALIALGLNKTKIVRLTECQPNRMKTTKIKKYIERMI